MRTHESACVPGFLRAYAGLILRMDSDFQKPKQCKFSVSILRFEMNPTSSGDCSKPFFLHYKELYMVYFQNTQKSNEKTLRFTRNSESEESF